MKITHLRNASMIIHFDEQVILVDPMLADKGAIPSLKYFTKTQRRNPLVELPDITEQQLNQVTHCLITHCQKGHFDHLDKAGTRWLREHKIPVLCAQEDADFLQKKGLIVMPLTAEDDNVVFNGKISLIPCLHGEGVIGKFMAHGYGYVIKLANQPSLYIAGDTLLTDDVRAAIHHHNPAVIVVPAGGALFDLGSELIMDDKQAIEVGHLTDAKVVANHLEALDHCPITRAQILEQVNSLGWQQRFFVPDDGESLIF